MLMEFFLFLQKQITNPTIKIESTYYDVIFSKERRYINNVVKQKINGDQNYQEFKKTLIIHNNK